MRVVLGVNALSQAKESFAIEKILINPTFDPDTLDNDIALLKLVMDTRSMHHRGEW